MKKNERLQALKILVRVVQDKVPLTQLFHEKPDSSSFTKALCFGVCRHYFRLQAIADSLMAKRPKDCEIWMAILIGLYQLYFMEKPDYATVKETVALLTILKKVWAKGLVNAVLRTFCRDQVSLLEQLQNLDSFKHGHPTWFILRLKEDWPNDWQRILLANDCHPPFSLRINQRQIQRKHYLEYLQTKKIKAYCHSDSPAGLTLETPCEVSDLPGFTTGELSVQDEAAQLAVDLLALKPGLRVLDACCAPGGKTCHILESESELETCVAIDIDDRRLQRVRENLNRLKLQATLLQADALHPELWWDGNPFDRILLDAPCSATGVIRRHPDIKLLRQEADIGTIAELQKALLLSLWPLLSPQGLLVYVTCSLLKEENEKQVAKFISNQRDCEFVNIAPNWGIPTKHGWQILTGDKNKDGFFYSVLRKISYG